MINLITIEVADEGMIVHEGEKFDKARLVWACSDLQVWVIGSLSGLKYEQAANLALNVCVERHIPSMSLKRVSPQPKRRDIDTETKPFWERRKW